MRFPVLVAFAFIPATAPGARAEDPAPAPATVPPGKPIDRDEAGEPPASAA
jgi:hypothetical protein